MENPNKFKIHLPTAEYAFIEQEVEGTPLEAVAAYKNLENAFNGFNPYESLKDLEFNKKVDKYLMTTKLDADEYEECNAIQKMVLQTIKRAYARIQAKA